MPISFRALGCRKTETYLAPDDGLIRRDNQREEARHVRHIQAITQAIFLYLELWATWLISFSLGFVLS